MARTAVAPFLITRNEAGQYRITVRQIRFNSQGYPLLTSTVQPEVFKSATAARTYARQHLGAQAQTATRLAGHARHVLLEPLPGQLAFAVAIKMGELGDEPFEGTFGCHSLAVARARECDFFPIRSKFVSCSSVSR